MRSTTLTVGILLCGAASLLAQQRLDHPVGQDIQYPLDSGIIGNRHPTDSKVVFSNVITVPDAAWMRLYFRDTRLGPQSFLRLTSLWDREVQDLDQTALEMWNDTSAYFNGNQVLVELFAAPGTTQNRVALDHLAIEYGNPIGGQVSCGICGADNRFPSSQDWSGRIVPVGCSGSVWNTDSCVVSAGHCVGGDTTIEFRVPPSNPDCSIVHPPVADQFPIVKRKFNNNGVGDDWSVMVTGTNNLGQTIYGRYGAFRPIATSPANVGDNANVWGFGIDDECVRSQVQQDSAGGTIGQRFGTYYTFSIDITFGNSGSGLIKTSNSTIVGIVTHCSDGCPDYATRVDNSDFAAARDELCPKPNDCTTPVNYGSGTAGTFGLVPHITSANFPKIGSSDFVIRGENTETGLNGFLVIGFGQATIFYGSTVILVDITGPHLFVPIKTVGSGLPGGGFIEVQGPIPNNPALDGVRFFSQFLFLDSGAQSGLSATEGLDATICCGC